MSFLSRLFGSLFGGRNAPAGDVAGRNAFWMHVRCNACGEAIRVRINREHDLSAEYEEGSDAPSGYHVHKEVVGQRCFRRIQVDVTLDGSRRVTDQQIQGGAFITPEEFAAAQDATSQESAGGSPVPPSSPTSPSA